jgi:integrase
MPIRKRKNVYYIDFSHNGRRYRKKIGKDKKTAELTLKEIEVKIAKGEYLGISEQNKILFESFANDYLEYAKIHKKPNTYRNDYSNMHYNLLPFFSGKYLHKIDVATIEGFKNRKIPTGKLTATNRCLALLSNMLTIAIDRGFVNTNPVKKVKRLKEPPGRVRFLNDLELEKLIKELNGTVRSIVIAAYNTGMRKGELLKLQWCDIDIPKGIIKIENTKNNETRYVPINTELKAELQNMPRYGNFVFSKKDGQPYRDLKKAFKSALKRAGIENFRFHDLRHCFASDLAMKGVEQRTIAQLLGHKTLLMTMRYSHLSQPYLKETVNLLVKKSDENVTNRSQTEVDK